MRKQTFSKTSFFLALLLLMFQLVFPIANTSAATNSSILPPSNLAAQMLTPDDVKLTWSPVYGAVGYNVYGITEGQLSLLGKATTTSYNFSNLAEGSYSYVVSTSSAEGESGPSAPVSVNIVYPDMAAPATLTYVFKNGNDIVLNWDASQYAQSYNLYQLSVEGKKTLITSTAARTNTVSNAPAGQYTYSVSAVNTLYGESPLSSPVQVEVVYPIMKAPGNVTYTLTNGSDVTLKWDSVSYATKYYIYQIIDGQQVLKSTVTNTTVKLSSVPAGEYVYEIHSNSDRFGDSKDGSQISVTVGAVIMSAPANFIYKVQNTNDIALTWGSVPYATSYKVYQIIDGQKSLKSTIIGTTITYTNVAAGGEYVYEIHSYSDRFGESEEGSTVAVVIGDVTMAAPGSFAYKIQNGNDIVLSWGSSSNANNYKVYQIIDGQKVLKSTATGTSITYSNMPAGDYAYEVHSFSTRFGESQDGSQLSFTLVPPTMLPPTNLVQTIKSATDFTLSWDASSYATSYKVYQIVNGQKSLKSTVSATTVSYSNMSPGEYTFKVYTYSSRFGESSEGTLLTMTLNGQTMQTPTNLTYSISNGNDITMRWSAVQYATSYKIYQMIDGQKVLKSTVTGTSITYPNMPGGEYDYIINAFSTLLGESPSGAEVKISLVIPTMAAPGNLTSKILNGNDVVLSWGAVQYATSYKVYELVDGQKVLKSTVSSSTATLSRVPVGEHAYVVHSVSTRFGESPEGSIVSLTLNEQIMKAPGNLTYTITSGNDITLKWDAVTYATSYKVYQVIDGQPVLKKTVTSTYASFTNMPEGNYIYEVHSYSDRFGESSEASQTSITLVFPTMKEPLNLTHSITVGNDITLRWNAVTYATAYKVYQIIDGQSVLKKTVPSTYASFTNMPEGDYKYEVHSYSDRFGESPTSSTLNLTLIWPEVQPPTLKGTVFSANNMTLSWQAVTWANEYRVYKIAGDIRELIYKGTALSNQVYNLTEETHSFEVTAFSTRFGESAPSNRITQTVVYPIMQPPVASLKLLSTTSAQITWNFVTYANGYNVFEIVDGNPVLLVKNLNNLSYTVSNLPYANHEYYVTSYSNSFGESETSNTVLAKLIVDTEPPVTMANAPTDWTNQNPVITLSATDNETGVANTYYSLNDGDFVAGTSFTTNGEGIHKVSFYSVDKVGNIEATKTIFIKVDQIAPVTKISEIPAWSTQSAALKLTVTDAQSGVAKTFFSINGSEYVEATSFTVDKEGVNKVSFYSVDQAGNIEKAQTVEVKVDKTAPMTTSDALAEWSKADVTVKLTATDTQAGVAKTFYSIDGSEYVEGTSFTVDKEGVNQVSFYSVDQAGNTEKAQNVEVKVDKTAPVTTSDASTAWSKEDVTVKLTATDAQSGIAKTFFSINGSEYVEGSFTIDKEGVNQVSFYSVDQAGNTENAQTVEVKVDKTAPVTTSDAPAAWSKEDVTVKLTAMDAQSGVAKIFYSIDGSEYVEGTNFTLGKEGIHQISFYGVDKAGNEEKVKTAVFKVDKSAPVVSWNIDGEYVIGSKLNLTYIAKDNVSGIASESLTLNGQTLANGSTVTIGKPGAYKLQVVVTDQAGWITTMEKTITFYLPGIVKLEPKVIKENKGKFTVKVSLPKELEKEYGKEFSKDFDLFSVTLNGVKPISDKNAYEKKSDKGEFKFNREDFTWNQGEVELEFRGMLDGGLLVVGRAIVEVKDK